MQEKMSNIKIGFTIGKFAPFHKGHEYLIETALKEMDEFYVVVYDTPEFNIDINTKIRWIIKKFPNVKILKAFNSPKQYGLDEKSVKLQMEYLEKIVNGIRVNYFYSSEPYGKYVADYLHIENVLVDKDRKKYPISARMIRNDVEKYEGFISKEVANYFFRKHRECRLNLKLLVLLRKITYIFIFQTTLLYML